MLPKPQDAPPRADGAPDDPTSEVRDPEIRDPALQVPDLLFPDARLTLDADAVEEMLELSFLGKE
ncbi:MAG: hypothetical protein AAGF23_27135, partial [Acidobacteriota bacterium]